MDLNEYQQLAMRTANSDLSPMARVGVAALGLAGEAGEVADTVKKHIGHGHKMDIDALEYELGDVLWYVAVMARLYNLDLNDVAARNIFKLKTRYPEGFSSEASINRKAYRC